MVETMHCRTRRSVRFRTIVGSIPYATTIRLTANIPLCTPVSFIRHCHQPGIPSATSSFVFAYQFRWIIWFSRSRIRKFLLPNLHDRLSRIFLSCPVFGVFHSQLTVHAPVWHCTLLCC